jgi:hypothetical protein
LEAVMLTAPALWSSQDPDRWRATLAAYPAVVAAQAVGDLEELDAWYRDRLPAAIAARQPPSLDAAEMEGVVRWKMKRGEWRPRNLALLRDNPPEQVRLRTERAFELVPDERAPLEEIAHLAGVGPATASAALAAYRPDLYPFLDELVGAAIPELGPPRFTLPYYLRYARALRARAAALGPPWTAQDVGLALWAAAGGKAAVG